MSALSRFQTSAPKGLHWTTALTDKAASALQSPWQSFDFFG
ncbi:uncharacterized protein CTRU02_200875 [Colletotrichum truncatum]|uniref:Uncharacterized protein n=1 Tax=Colletotrichum truncatum TaxID=5467 RepID=A0ACC3ZFR2_COLTU